MGRLAQAGALVVRECFKCNTNQDVPPSVPALTGLPGLIRLQQINAPSNQCGLNAPSGSLTVYNTAFRNLSTFSALVCPPGYTNILNNPGLVTLAGLEGLNLPTLPPGVAFFASGNPFSGPASVDAIARLAGCPTGLASPQLSPLWITTSTCTLTVRAWRLLLSHLFPCGARLTILPSC